MTIYYIFAVSAGLLIGFFCFKSFYKTNESSIKDKTYQDPFQNKPQYPTLTGYSVVNFPARAASLKGNSKYWIFAFIITFAILAIKGYKDIAVFLLVGFALSAFFWIIKVEIIKR